MFIRAFRVALRAVHMIIAAGTPALTPVVALSEPARPAPGQHLAPPMLIRPEARKPRGNPGCPGGALGASAFVGGGFANAAAGVDSAVLGGQDNQSCDSLSGIGAGYLNIVADAGLAKASFIAGGEQNSVYGGLSFVGAGLANLVFGSGAFVGAGYGNVAEGAGAMVGAGGAFHSDAGNLALGIDSFVGAGDANSVSDHGAEAFVGAGYGNSAQAAGAIVGAGGTNGSAFGTNAGNRASGIDSFVGAGDANVAASDESFLGAGSDNAIGTAFGTPSTVESAIVAGYQNSITAAAGTAFFGSFIGAGGFNTVSAGQSVITGGYGNVVSQRESFVGAGQANFVANSFAFDGAGFGNRVMASRAFIGAGYKNDAGGSDAVVPGGFGNVADGSRSFAAGTGSHALHTGTFVWSDAAAGAKTLASTAANQFLVRASGGVILYSNSKLASGVKLAPGSGTWSSLSDRNAKANIVPADPQAILERVTALPVTEWSYRTEDPRVRHLGPMAQDFYDAFRLGEDDRHITSVDEEGVALAAIQALEAQIRDMRARDAKLEARDAELEARVAALQSR